MSGPQAVGGTPARAGVHRAGHRWATWLWRAVAVGFAAVMVFPVYWMVNSAFEPNNQITSLTPSFFPVHFTLHNFVRAVDHTAGTGSGQAYFWDDARNSAIVSLQRLPSPCCSPS